MLRVAATLLALLAALPPVTPMVGGYKVFTSECGRNLTHVLPSRKWPELPTRTYNYTGLLVMPGDVCSGSLVCPKMFLSTSLCRLWKDKVDFANDIEDEGSEVRIGIIQGEVSTRLYQRQLVKRYLHYKTDKDKLMEAPVMLVEVEEEFSGWTTDTLPGVYRKTPLSKSDASNDKSVMVEVVGYENSANLPIYHQSTFDARLWVYVHKCKNNFGRTTWDLGMDGACTWDVSPVRTVCSIDRGAPVMLKKNVAAIVLGVVDDLEKPGNFCGEGRIHYNIFLTLGGDINEWMNKQTDGMMKIMELVDGKALEVCPEDDRQPPAPPRPGQHRPPKRPKRPKTTTKRPRKSGSGRQMVSVWPLLLSIAVTLVRLVLQY